MKNQMFIKGACWPSCEMVGTNDVAITGIGIVGGIDVVDRRQSLCRSRS
jgi:hypothetical protein